MIKTLKERYKRMVIDFRVNSEAHMNLLDDLDKTAEFLGMSRANLARQLLKEGLVRVKNEEAGLRS